MKVLNNQITAVIEYGFIEIETSGGVVRYSFQRGSQYDDNLQLETLTPYYNLSDNEKMQCDELAQSAYNN
jgi:hypothetical protein